MLKVNGIDDVTSIKNNTGGLNVNINSVMDTDRLLTHQSHRGHYFAAAEYSTNVANSVLITPTSSTSEIVVNDFMVTTSSDTGDVQIESTSTSVGYGGILAKLYASKASAMSGNGVHVHVGVGASLTVTITTGAATFVAVEYEEE